METAKWVVGAVYALVGILWIISGVAGTANYVYLGIGLVWLLGGACWPLGIHAFPQFTAYVSAVLDSGAGGARTHDRRIMSPLL